MQQIIRCFRGFLFSIILIWPSPVCAATDVEPPSLYVIERDTLQTRNFIPIVNHHTMAINLSEQSLKLQMESTIPPDKFRQTKFYPAFLEDSLLPDPLFSPLEVAPTNVFYVRRPETITENGMTSFIWKALDLPPGEALIAQYDNYFGEPNIYWRPEGIEIFGLKLRSQYSAKLLDTSTWELSFDYELVNDTGNAVTDLLIQLFIPLERAGEEEKAAFLDLHQISSSPNVEMSKNTRVDGFEQAAFGMAATINVGDLETDETVRFFLGFTGNRGDANGTMWSTLIFRGRSIQEPVWPPTRIKTKEPVSEGRFSYIAYNLVIQDSRVVTFSQEEVAVKSKLPEKEGAKKIIQISVNPNAVGAGLPSQEKIVSIGRELLERLFPEDLARSRRVDGLLSLVSREEDAFQFKIQAVYLYEKSYLAVNREVVFRLSGEHCEVLSSE